MNLISKKIVEGLREFADCKHEYWRCEGCKCRTHISTFRPMSLDKAFWLAKALKAYEELAEALQEGADNMVAIVNDPDASSDELHAALATLAEILDL